MEGGQYIPLHHQHSPSTPSCLLSPPPHHHCQQNCETRNNWLLPTLWYSLVRVSLQSGMDFMIFVVAETCTLQSKFVSSNTSAVEIPSKKTVNRLFQNITKTLNQRTAFLKMFWFMFWRPINVCYLPPSFSEWFSYRHCARTEEKCLWHFLNAHRLSSVKFRFEATEEAIIFQINGEKPYGAEVSKSNIW